VRILTVCLGNICRSPTAEAALVEAAAAIGAAVEVASAGTGDWHLGEPPDPRMRAAAAAQGLPLRGTAAQVDARMLAEADLVVAMDRSNLRDLRTLAAESGVDTPIVLFRAFDPEVAAVPAAEGPVRAARVRGPDREYAADEVPDPYQGGPEHFTEVVAMCRRTAAAIVADLAGTLVRARAQTPPGA
jgi:protein-tyrosine phosphatase